jgi:hypothetical protein
MGGIKLTQKKMDDMFRAYQEKQSFNYISKKCKVANQTVKNVAKRERWKERLIKIREAQELINIESVAQVKARWQRVIRETVERYCKQLKKSKGTFVSPGVLKSLMEAEMYLVGEPTSRIEIRLVVERWTERVIRVINEHVPNNEMRNRISRDLAALSGEESLLGDSNGNV